MNKSFGPWSTAIGADHYLSTFWKRRLAMFPALSRTPSTAARRTLIFAIALAATILLIPAMEPGSPSNSSGVSTRQRAGIAWGDAFTAAGAPGKDADFVEYLPRPTALEQKFTDALEKPIDVDFVEVPFDECIAILEKKTGIPFHLDRERLTEEIVALDRPISQKSKGRSLEIVLNEILRPANLDFFFEDERVNVTTAYTAEENFVTRWYPVWDLDIGLKNLTQPNVQASKFINGRIVPSNDELILAIETTIRPDSWKLFPALEL